MISQIYIDDAKNLKKKVERESIDVTITSPPYFDMKDYGHSNQIGYGQSYKVYLKDLKKVFKDIYYATKRTGSLWIIIDTFKRDGVVVPLPFDFAKEVSSIGWKLQDIIIWKKDKTVPWSKKGSTRKIFEYILFFSKSEEYKYYSERTREVRELKEWWVRYPERYSPSGKSLEEIWEFSIPTQGSWGDKYIRHFCPLPKDLVKRIITLTTDENDIVFDPFVGSGTVPAQAAFMNRKYLGFELNKSYVEMFENYLTNNFDLQNNVYLKSKKSIDVEVFGQNIVNLRILKYGRSLVKKLKSFKINIKNIWVEKLNIPVKGKFEVASAKYVLFSEEKIVFDDLIRKIHEITSYPPLSKFGINSIFELKTAERDFIKIIPEADLFIYTLTNTHKYKYKLTKNALKKDHFIISDIAVNINEEIYKDTQ